MGTTPNPWPSNQPLDPAEQVIGEPIVQAVVQIGFEGSLGQAQIPSESEPLPVTVVGGSSGNPAAGPTGSPVPADADYIGINVGGNLEGVSTSNPLPITGSITASNPSVGSDGSPAPSSSTQIGSQDASGNLQAASASNPIPVAQQGDVTVVGTGTFAAQVTGTVTAKIEDSSGNALDSTGGALNVQVENFPATQPVSGTVTAEIEGHAGATLDSAAGTPNSQALTIQGNSSGVPVPVSGTGNFTVVQSSGASLHVDVDNFPSTQAVTQSTSPWIVAGAKTSNNAAPDGTNVGVLPAIANAAAPTYTEGDQVLLSTDLSGNLRTLASISISSLPLPPNAAQESGGNLDKINQYLEELLIKETDVYTWLQIFYESTLGNGGMVPVSGAVTATVSGSVSVSNFPATQPVSGTVQIEDTTGNALSSTSGSLNVYNTNPVQYVLGGPVSVELQDGLGNQIYSTANALNVQVANPVNTFPLPTNAAQETGGNLAAINSNTQFEPQVNDLLKLILTQLKVLNLNVAAMSGISLTSNQEDGMDIFTAVN